jgi:hypothetical protein
MLGSFWKISERWVRSAKRPRIGFLLWREKRLVSYSATEEEPQPQVF